MQAVIETSTGKALYLFADTDVVEITDAGMTGPIRAMDLRPETHSIVTATQPAFFVGGGVMQWDDGWVILDQAAYDAAYAAAQPPEPEPYLNNTGMIRFTGTSPVQTLEAIRMAGAARIAKGRYRVYHVDPYPNDQYGAFPSIFDASPRAARVTARTETYVEVRVTDLLGVAQDPAELTVRTDRVITP